jgi:hypothetical protein
MVVYLIEISKMKTKVAILLFPNYDDPKVYLAEVIYERIAYKLMRENQNLFEIFVKSFSV